MPTRTPIDPRQTLIGLITASRDPDRSDLRAATDGLITDLASHRELAVTALVDIVRRVLEFSPMADAVLQVVAEDLAAAEPLPARLPAPRSAR